MSLLYASLVILAVLPAVASSSQFDAPPLVQADVGVDSILLIGTVIQLAIAIIAVFRTKARLPAIGAVAALTTLLIGYALDIASTVGLFSSDVNEAELSFINLTITSSLFDYWIDAAVFVAFALVLHNRYRSVKHSSRALVGFAAAFGFLLLMMVTLVAAEVGIIGALTMKYPHGITITGGQTAGPALDAYYAYRARARLSNNIFFAFVAFYIISTIFLAVCVFLVRNRTRRDTIMSLMLFAITPLLLFRAFIRLLFTILQNRLPLTIGYTIEVRQGLILAQTLLEGLLYLAVMGVLVYFSVRTHLWEAQPESSAHPAAPAKFAGQGGPSTQYFMPPAQFPGQWGYPQQQQQQPTPQQQQQQQHLQPPYGQPLQQQQQLPYGQPQQYAYVPVYPNQNPGAQIQPSPGDEKDRPLPVPPNSHPAM